MSTDNPLSKQAAKASWVTASLALFGVLILGPGLSESNPAALQIIWLITPLFLILGLGLGVFALTVQR